MLPVFALEPPWYNVLFPAAFIILWVAFLVVAGVLGVAVLWRVYQFLGLWNARLAQRVQAAKEAD